MNPLSDDDEDGRGDSFSDEDSSPVRRASSDEEMGNLMAPLSPQMGLTCLPPWQTHFVLVKREERIEEQRIKLPVYGEEQYIMETLRVNPVTIICGETGSGKTTQVPQFLYEAGFGDKESANPGLIGVTQPRRVAAISMAKRVGEELNKPEHVAHQVRYDASMTADTRIKFMTDGILLREISEDFLLSKYSIILLDEAHERNLNTDILIGMLSRSVRLRNQLACAQPEETKPLRIIIMSATLNIDEFISPRLFTPAPPLIKVDARQHPVTMHFSRKTPSDYIDAAYKMCCKIHANLPPGGILVFLTGKQEIVRLARKLNSKYSQAAYRKHLNWQEDDTPWDDEQGECELKTDEDSNNDEGEDEFMMGAETREPLHVLPLYSLLAPEEQAKVFQPPPEGARLCVLATNVAETSLTIPNIRYVVDSGLVKQRHFDPISGAQQYRIEWTSKASATQRAGRAGRVGPGHCYRLYSSAVFDQQFSDFSSPEIQRTPIEGLVLQLKTMGIDHPERFPLPSPPEPEAVLAAQKSLIRMGALCTSGEAAAECIRISLLGRRMARLPLSPLWSRLAIISLEMNEHPLLSVALASVMSVGDPFMDDHGPVEDRDEGKQNHSLRTIQAELAGKPPCSDLLMWLNAFTEYMKKAKGMERSEFCAQYRLMPKRMEEMIQQFALLKRMVQELYPPIDYSQPMRLRRPAMQYLCKLICESLGDRVAERITLPNVVPGLKRLSLPAYRLLNRPDDDPSAIVYLHPTSVLKGSPPKLLAYTELTQSVNVRYIKYVTAIEAGWLD